MIIKELMMNNFRQFRGENKITFSSGPQNITLIFGENGNGKTGIFRAIIFVLYGDKSLDQDNAKENRRNKKGEEIHLVNLDELKEHIGEPVTATVKLKFENNNKNYIIERSIQSRREINNEITSNFLSPKLYEINENGDAEAIRDNQVEVLINSILDNEIKDFFFFDAERMSILEKLTAKNDISKYVRNNMYKLLQIRSLNEAEKELSSLIREKRREINAKSQNSDLAAKTRELENIDDCIKKYKADMINFSEEIDNLKEIIADDEERLENSQKTREINAKINEINSDIKDYKESFNYEKVNLKRANNRLIISLGEDVLRRNEAKFNDLLKSKNASVPIHLINESLENMCCALCGKAFTMNDSQYELLVNLQEKYKYSEIASKIQSIVNFTSSLDSKSTLAEVDKYLKSMNSYKEKLENKERIKDQLNRQLTLNGNQIRNLNEIEEHLESNKNRKDELEDKRKETKDNLHLAEGRKQQAERDRDRITKTIASVEKEELIIEKLQKIREIITKLISEYTKLSNRNLSFEIGNIFNSLLADKDKGRYEINVSDNFDIEILDRYHINSIRDVSQGQSQIFTLAFILALVKLARKGRNVNFPLFMDTPFGRLSSEHRNNLIKTIPTLTDQWILLLTDTELTNVEARCFEQTNRVGKIYKLHNNNGVTNIERKNNIEDLKIRR